jgi:hypothetical protein
MVDPRRRAATSAPDGESITTPQRHEMSDMAALA